LQHEEKRKNCRCSCAHQREDAGYLPMIFNLFCRSPV
jgi:hypothetical protein